MLDKLIDFILSGIKMFYFLDVVMDWELAIVMRMGKFNRILTPGLHLKIPFGFEEVVSVTVVLETQNVGPQSLMTKDLRNLVVSSVITYTIKDAKTFLLRVMDAKNVIEDTVYGIVAEEIMNVNSKKMDIKVIRLQILEKIKNKIEKWGVEIIDYNFSDFSLNRSLRLMGKIDGHVPEVK